MAQQIGLSPEAIGQWAGLVDDWRLRNAEKPYLKGTAKTKYEMELANLEGKKISNEYAGQTELANALYKQAMAQYLSNPNQQLKGLSNVGKGYGEQAIIDQFGLGGLVPALNRQAPQNAMAPPMNEGLAGNGKPGPASLQVNPAQIQAMRQQGIGQAPPQMSPIHDAYARAIQRGTTDSKVREKSLYAENIEKTFSNVDEDLFKNYAGAKGKATLAADKLAVLEGKAPPRYIAYSNFVNEQVPLLASQIRQFYGDSIQPSQLARLEKMANPDTWINNPEVALNDYNQLKSLLHQEITTYAEALKKPIDANALEQPIQSKAAAPKNQLKAWADEAIKNGADSAKVNARLQQMTGGG